MKHFFHSPKFLAALGAILLVFLMGGIFLFDEGRQYTAVIQEHAPCKNVFEAKEFTFKYPCSWIVEKNTRVRDDLPTMVLIQTDTNSFETHTDKSKNFFMKIGESFDTFEDVHPTPSIEEGTLHLHEKAYPTKLYHQRGGSSYVIHFNDSYIEFGSEDYFYQEQNEWDEVMLILQSLEIK